MQSGKQSKRDPAEATETGRQYLSVGAVSTLAICPRKFYYGIRFKFVKKNRMKKSKSKKDSKAAFGIESIQLKQQLLSSDKLWIRGMCKTVKDTHPPVPVVIRNRLDEKPWELTQAVIQLFIYALLFWEKGLHTASGMILDPGSDRQLSINIRPNNLISAAVLIGKAHIIADMEYAPEAITGIHCETCSYRCRCMPKSEILLKSSSDESEEPRSQISVFRNDDALPLYVKDQGTRISVCGRIFRVGKENGSTQHSRPFETSQICIFGNVQITTQALRLAFANEIPVVFMTFDGALKGTAGAFSTRNALRKKAQFEALSSSNTAMHISSRLINAKIRNCRNLLRRNSAGNSQTAVDELTHYSKKSLKCSDRKRLRGYEGIAARHYLSKFSGMLSEKAIEEGFQFSGRTRRPPKDPINAMLSLGYALLLKDVIIALKTAGLDPMHGFYHVTRSSRPALALDLMEFMRPLIVDSVVLSVINNSRIRQDDFEKRNNGIYFIHEGSRKFIAEYERRLATIITDANTGQKIRMRTAVYRAADDLALYLGGRLKEFRPFVRR